MRRQIFRPLLSMPKALPTSSSQTDTSSLQPHHFSRGTRRHGDPPVCDGSPKSNSTLNTEPRSGGTVSRLGCAASMARVRLSLSRRRSLIRSRWRGSSSTSALGLGHRSDHRGRIGSCSLKMGRVLLLREKRMGARPSGSKQSTVSCVSLRLHGMRRCGLLMPHVILYHTTSIQSTSSALATNYRSGIIRATYSPLIAHRPQSNGRPGRRP